MSSFHQVGHYMRNFESLKEYVCGERGLCPDSKARAA